MLCKKNRLAMVVVCCLFIITAGCPKKNVDETSEGAIKTSPGNTQETLAEGLRQIAPDPYDVKTPALPSETELNAIGPIREENRELLRFMPDNPSSFVVLNPARVIQTPFFVNEERFAEDFVSRFIVGFQFVPFLPLPADRQITFSNIKRMTFCSTPVKQKLERDPMTGQFMQILPENLRTLVCVLEFNAPIDDDLLMLSLFNIYGNVQVETLAPVMAGNMKAYDMIPPTVETPFWQRLVIVSPTTVVFASGNASEVTKVFDSEPAQGAIPSRLLHTDLQNTDMIAMYSTEGVPFGFIDMSVPYKSGSDTIAVMQGQQLELEQVEEGFTAFVSAVKAMSIRFNLQAADEGHLIQADMDCLLPADADTWKKNMEKSIADLLTTMSFAIEQARQTAPPQEQMTPEQVEAFENMMKTAAFSVSTVEGLKVASSGNKLQLALKKAAGFDQILAEILVPAFAEERLQHQANQDYEAMRMILPGIERYLDSNGMQFPHYAIFGENGMPLLSWRVALLPSLGEVELYNQFRLNEPWDSEHNRELIARMPQVYADPSGQTPAGKTIFRMIGGEGSFLSKFPNGFAWQDLVIPPNTIYMISVTPEQSVEWTRPEFVQYQPETFDLMVKPVFAAMFCSGVVQLLAHENHIVASQLRYWIAGEISPEVAEQMKAREAYEQFLQQEQQRQQLPMEIPPMPPIGQQ